MSMMSDGDQHDRGLGGALQAYIEGIHGPDDQVLRDLLLAAEREGLPPIQVPPTLGKLLGLLVHISGAARILEIGTLGGYSAIHLGRALPAGGSLISLELEARHAAVARQFIVRAGLERQVEVRVGPALESLARLAGQAPFDFVFIDADKPSYPAYLDWALRLTRPGSLIVADNVLRNGAVLDEHATDAGVTAIRAYNERVAHDPRLEAVILIRPAAMSQEIDGVSIARVRDAGDSGH